MKGFLIIIVVGVTRRYPFHQGAQAISVNISFARTFFYKNCVEFGSLQKSVAYLKKHFLLFGEKKFAKTLLKLNICI